MYNVLSILEGSELERLRMARMGMEVHSTFDLKAIWEVKIKIKQIEIPRQYYIAIVTVNIHLHNKEQPFAI